MNSERLKLLADKLVEAPFELDMFHWKCGTAVCAGGLACMIPEFNKLGLCFSPRSGGFKPCFGWEVGYDALREFFDISLEDTLYIFSPQYYDTDEITVELVQKHILQIVSTQ